MIDISVWSLVYPKDSSYTALGDQLSPPTIIFGALIYIVLSLFLVWYCCFAGWLFYHLRYAGQVFDKINIKSDNSECPPTATRPPKVVTFYEESISIYPLLENLDGEVNNSSGQVDQLSKPTEQFTVLLEV